jgi:hypothetical protein
MGSRYFPTPADEIGKATVTASTGSPTIDSATRAGKTIYKFTGSGTITVGAAGYAEILVIGGGGAGPNAGGMTYDADLNIFKYPTIEEK